MRLVSLFAAAAAAYLPVAAVPAAAQDAPVRTAPLAPREVLLQVMAIGEHRSRADTATLNVTVSATGPSARDARAGAEAQAARIGVAARAAGVADSDVQLRSSLTSANVEIEQMMAAAAAAREGSAAPAEPRQATAVVQLILRQIDRLPQLRQALLDAGAADVPDPQYRLSDDRPARRAARAAAIETARADAEAYAAAMGMRVLRVVRVTERLGMEMFSTMFSAPEAMLEWRAGRNGGPDVDTRLVIGVDFALAPR